MEPRLASVLDSFSDIRRDAASIQGELSNEQLLWRPKPGVWSVGDHFAHLNSIDGQDLPGLFTAITAGRKEGKMSAGPFQWSWFERFFIRIVSPPVRLKVKAPAKYVPELCTDPRETYQEFERVQNDLKYLIQQADGLDIKAIKVVSPVSKLIRMSIGARLELLAAHDRRHLWTMRKLMGLPEFPKKA